MNYEEKYNEILEWARKNKARLNGVPIEEVLPELAESEDERTRKEMLAFFKNFYETGTWKSISDVNTWIAYLEKQKDLDKMIVVSPEVWDKAIADAYENGKKEGEEQKEQKPAEWSEEDEKYLNRVINLWVNDFDEDSDTVKWLKSLRPSWKPSEEELGRKHLEGYCMGREDTLREMKDFIESHFNCENAKKGTPIVYNTQSGTSTLKAEG